MEELGKKVESILNQFGTEELGNRLSQFAMLSLKSMILNEIKNHKVNDKKSEVNTLRPVEKEAVKEVKK